MRFIWATQRRLKAGADRSAVAKISAPLMDCAYCIKFCHFSQIATAETEDLDALAPVAPINMHLWPAACQNCQ